MQKKKMIPITVFILLMFAFVGRTIASDLDIFNVVSEDVSPNVLIVLDLSGSMNTSDVRDASGKTRKRIDVAKDALVKIIQENPNVRWGLFTFPNSGTAQSGILRSGCQSRTESELKTFISQVEKLSTGGNTPVCSALAEAGLYYAGLDSFFWSGTKYTSPIENECQNNYIILITDGYSNYDSGVKGGYTSYNSDDRYNMSGKNSIFLKPYINGKVIGNYITNHGLGAQLSSFVDNLTLPKTISTTNYANITWSRVESGSPSLGHTGLGVNRQLTSTAATSLKNSNKPYTSGY